MKLFHKSYIPRVTFLIIVILIFIYCFNNLIKPKPLSCTQNSKEVSNKENQANFKLEYFDDAVGIWGSGLPNNETQWNGIDSKYAQRSAPAVVTHPLGLKQELVNLVPIKISEIKYQPQYPGEEEPSYFKSAVKDMYLKYGESLGGYFASKGETVTSLSYFDVDNDKVKEQIVETVTIGGNHPPYFGYIIKGGTVILSMPLNSGGIDSTKDGNGFYVKNMVYEEEGLCCPVGYRLYRIVFENNSFKPVWEQEVKYIRF